MIVLSLFSRLSSLYRTAPALSVAMAVVLGTAPSLAVSNRGGESRRAFVRTRTTAYQPASQPNETPGRTGEREPEPDAQSEAAADAARSASPPAVRDLGREDLLQGEDFELDELCETDPVLLFEPGYIGEVFSNTRGGISTKQATQYQGLIDLALTVDLEAMQSPLPGQFFVLGQNTHGRGISEDFVGDIQTLSNIDSFDNIMQVTEYWWEFPVWDENLIVRLGKQDVNTEFHVLDMASDFIQSTMGITPTIGLPTYPETSVAAVLLAQLTDDLIFRVGVFDGLPDGERLWLSDSGSVFTIGELEYSWGGEGAVLPGSCDLGAGYLSSGTAVAGEPISRFSGFYFEIEQLLLRESCCDDDAQGLGGFAQIATVHDDQVVEITDTFSGGIIYRGLLPDRDEDVIGIGFSRAWLTLGGRGHETAVELFYKAVLSPRVVVQPDLQYIASPSGIYRDALAAGLRFSVTR